MPRKSRGPGIGHSTYELICRPTLGLRDCEHGASWPWPRERQSDQRRLMAVGSSTSADTVSSTIRPRMARAFRRAPSPLALPS